MFSMCLALGSLGEKPSKSIRFPHYIAIVHCVNKEFYKDTSGRKITAEGVRRSLMFI